VALLFKLFAKTVQKTDKYRKSMRFPGELCLAMCL